MVFSEHGRIGLLNPFILLMMFSSVHSEDTTKFIKRGNLDLFKKQFGSTVTVPDLIIGTAFMIAQIIYLTMKPALTDMESHQFPSLIQEYRLRLQSMLVVSGKPQRAHIPNIHIGIHYSQDILNYANSRNISVMIGEQKHKIHKAHAPHTNSRDRVLQLMKNVNLQQTIRMMLDNVFSHHAPSSQLQRILINCPILRHKFLGSTTPNTTKQGNIIVDHAEVIRGRVGLSLALRSIHRNTQRTDTELLAKMWLELEEVTALPGMKLSYQYWQKATMQLNAGNHIRKISIPIGSIISHGADTATRTNQPRFFRVERIASVTYGSARRCMLLVHPLKRKPELESPVAPYQVFVLATRDQDLVEVLPLQNVRLENLHFVRRDPVSWWWNPFVIHFL